MGRTLIVAVSVVSLGSATLHPGAFCGTKFSVLGVAEKISTPGARVPSAMESRVDQNVVSVRPEGWSVPRKFVVAGIMKHADAVVIVPNSIFHRPPGVRSWLTGKARIRIGRQGPGVHVVFVTNSGTGHGAAGEEYVARTGSKNAVKRNQRAR